MIIGAHIPRESTIVKTMMQITTNGGNALQIFTTNPRSCNISNNTKYINESHLIKKYCNINKFAIVVHGPYVLNIAKPFKTTKREMEITDTFIYNDIVTANYIGAIGYVIHVGKYLTNSKEESIEMMRNNIKQLLEAMAMNNIKTKLVLETPAGQGTELLTDFRDFMNFYYSFTEKERELFKICIDTCHIWNAGYELNEVIPLIPNKNDIIIIHANNSKNNKGARVDRHEFILEGKIEPYDIKNFIEEFRRSIIILETPAYNYKDEIKFITD
jgi:deoxyribonuclease-4